MNPYAASFRTPVAADPANTSGISDYSEDGGGTVNEHHESWDATQQDQDAGHQVGGDAQYWDYTAEYDPHHQGYPVGYGPGYHQQVCYILVALCEYRCALVVPKMLATPKFYRCMCYLRPS